MQLYGLEPDYILGLQRPAWFSMQNSHFQFWVIHEDFSVSRKTDKTSVERQLHATQEKKGIFLPS